MRNSVKALCEVESDAVVRKRANSGIIVVSEKSGVQMRRYARLAIFASFIIPVRPKEANSAVVQAESGSVRERRRGAQVGGDLGRAFAQGVAYFRENPGAGVAEFFFGGGGDG